MTGEDRRDMCGPILAGAVRASPDLEGVCCGRVKQDASKQVDARPMWTP